MDWLIRLAVLALVTYALVVAVFWAFQERLLYLPDLGGGQATPADAGLDYRDITLKTADGERLHAWWVPRADAHAVVLFSHGNAGSIQQRVGSLRLFHDLGLSVLVYDYRGYGESTGRPGEEGTYRDIRAAWDWLIEVEGIPSDQVILFGRSLGGAVAAWLAERVDAAGLILESTFTSLPDLGAALYPWLPVRWLSRMEYDTRSRMASIHMPVLVVHSKDDEIIPFAHGRRLHQAAVGGQMLVLSGGHNTAVMESAETYRAGLRDFLERIVN